MESGKVIPAIDKRYGLEQTVEAIQRFKDAKHCGKIVVLTEDPTQQSDE